jgi:hypothetical protein
LAGRTASQLRSLEQGENLLGNVDLSGLHPCLYTRSFRFVGFSRAPRQRSYVNRFADEAAADAATANSVTQAALSVIGAWSDLDWG